MQKKTHSATYLKQRKFLLVLPVLALPFITLMFWALGGGKANSAIAQANIPKGLNLKLPDAKLKDEKGLNKLSFYQQATLDSMKAKEAERLDPYWNKLGFDSLDKRANRFKFDSGENVDSAVSYYGVDANKTKVYNKLDELKKALDKSKTASTRYSQQSDDHNYSIPSYTSSNNINTLQAMMQRIKEEKSEDPEITQLNNMLDKIMAIQKPAEKKEPAQKAEESKQEPKQEEKQTNISLLTTHGEKHSADTVIEKTSANGFYGVSDNDNVSNVNATNSIQAIIPETQTLVAGATVKLALSGYATIGNLLIPSGTFVYGTASIANERLKITITSIRSENRIVPVSLDVYDIDGQEGIYIPGSINRTVAKESANNAVGSMHTTTIDPTIGTEAASAGIEAAKSLFAKKTKLIKVTVRAGYQIFLQDNHKK